MDVAEPAGRGVARAAVGTGESGPVAVSPVGRFLGVELYSEVQVSLTFSRRHSSGSRFSAAIVSQRQSSRTRFSSSLDAAIPSRRYPVPSAGAILEKVGSALVLTSSGRVRRSLAVPSLFGAEVTSYFKEGRCAVHVYSGLNRFFFSPLAGVLALPGGLKGPDPSRSGPCAIYVLCLFFSF